MAPLGRICTEKRMAAGPVSEMRAEGEIKMLRESSCVSRSPRCGTVGAGPALLKGKPGRRARRGGNPGGMSSERIKGQNTEGQEGRRIARRVFLPLEFRQADRHTLLNLK